MGLGGLCALLCLLPEGRKLVAFGAAVMFPTVGLIMLPALLGERVREGASGLAFLTRLLGLIIFPFGWSLMGALHIVGLLAGTSFLVKAEQFAGIKAAHVLPLLMVGVFYAAYAVGSWDFWRRWLPQPIFWWQAGVALLVLLALVLMLVRTGNEAPGAVSEWELRARALLENLMNVRPRTKEFLIGHPVLVVAVAMLMANRRSWLPLLMLLGAIGQVSVVNTFCHLHSPLVVSLLRVAWGAGIGIALGLLLVLILRRGVRSAV
jgi:hypothetical protein